MGLDDEAERARHLRGQAVRTLRKVLVRPPAVNEMASQIRGRCQTIALPDAETEGFTSHFVRVLRNKHAADPPEDHAGTQGLPARAAVMANDVLSGPGKRGRRSSGLIDVSRRQGALRRRAADAVAPRLPSRQARNPPGRPEPQLRQAEVLAQRGPLVVAAEQAAVLQLRDHEGGKVLKPPGSVGGMMGTTHPSSWNVENVRVEAVRSLLVSENADLKQTAGACGFRDADTLRCAFMRRVGTTPAEYRRRHASA